MKNRRLRNRKNAKETRCIEPKHFQKKKKHPLKQVKKVIGREPKQKKEIKYTIGRIYKFFSISITKNKCKPYYFVTYSVFCKKYR
jgi:hypothetical protein